MDNFVVNPTLYLEPMMGHRKRLTINELLKMLESGQSIQAMLITQPELEIEDISEVKLYEAIQKAAALFKSVGTQAVYLFGSAAQGKMRADSDVDFAVIGLKPTLFFQVMGQIQDILPCPFDLIDLDMDTPFTRYLKQKGRLRYVA